MYRSVWNGWKRKILCVECEAYMVPQVAELAVVCPQCKRRVLYQDTEETLDEALAALDRELELWEESLVRTVG